MTSTGGIRDLITLMEAGESISEVIDLEGETLDSILIPSDWENADMTFLGSRSADGPFSDLVDTANKDIQIKAPAGKIIMMITEGHRAIYGARFIKIRSGTPNVPVIQTGNRSILIGTGSIG